MANGLVKQKQWTAAITLLEEYIVRYPESADAQRLTMGTILLQIQQKPQCALQVVDDIDAAHLTPKQRRAYQQMVELARKQIAEGTGEAT